MKRTIRFQLDGETYQVEVERHGDQLTVFREGECFTVSLLDTPDSLAEARPEAQSEPAPRSAAPASAPAAPAQSPAARTGASAGRPPGAGAAGAAAKAGVLYAPMTGLVKEVQVAVGSCVKKGDVVLVMEAMKMDVEVCAPATGVVAEVNVGAGQTVESQAPLLVIRD